MFGIFRKKTKETIYDGPIDKVLETLNQYDTDTTEFATAMRHLEELNKMKAQESQSRFSPDTVLIVVGNLLGILVIVAYEQKHVWRSEAKSFILRAK